MWWWWLSESRAGEQRIVSAFCLRMLTQLMVSQNSFVAQMHGGAAIGRRTF